MQGCTPIPRVPFITIVASLGLPAELSRELHSLRRLKDTTEQKIKVLSVENPQLPDVLPLKHEVGQNIAMHASPTAMNFVLSDFYLSDPFNFISPKTSP